MFYLYTSNQTERLTEQLGDILAAGVSPSLFTPELFLIQSRGMERMLSQYLANRFTVWGNSRYFLPLQFINHLCDMFGLEQGGNGFDREILTWRLEKILRDLSDPVMQPLQSYLQSDQPDLKRYQLARKLADMYDQYQLLRPDFLQTWQHNGRVSKETSESWQRLLWQRLRADVPGQKHRGEVIDLLLESLRRVSIGKNRPFDRLFVFGVHTMPRPFLSILHELSKLTDIHLFLLSPCGEYWGDLQTPKAAATERVERAQGGYDTFYDNSGFHPLLVNLGKQGADFNYLLWDLVEAVQEGADLYHDPLEDDSPTILEHLQSHLLNGSAESSAHRKVLAKDDSIMLVSCHSRMREIMVLKDHLLDWLQRDPDLELSDIIVMAPDIQQYAQLIPAVFRDIQYDISDRNVRKTNRHLDCFLHFLQLFPGRYGWSEILGLLERPEISKKLNISTSDFELIRYWVIHSGIRWGLSGAQKEQDGMPAFDSATWRAGLERMLMGLAMDSNSPVDTIVPFSGVEGGQAELLGRLCDFVLLLERSSKQCRSRHSLDDWATLLRLLCSELFVEENQPELDGIYQIISRLNEDFVTYNSEPIAFEVVKAWLEACSTVSSTSGFLRGRLNFCSMLPMRSIPFKCICLLGLNESDYPNKDDYAPFDLLGTGYRPGDRSRRSDDRYQMLEAILAARKRLYLSYIGQSQRTNAPIPPSVIIAEILEVLEEYYGIEDLTIHHPLHSFSPKYFTGDGEFFSYQQSDCQLSAALANKADAARGPWLNNPVDSSPGEKIELAVLESFITAPQAHFVRTTLGIQLRSWDICPEEHELFVTGGLDGYQADQAIISDLLDGRPVDQILAVLQANQQWPLGVVGELSFTERVSEIQDFISRVREVVPEGTLPATAVSCHFENLLLSGLVENRCARGLVFYRYGNLKGKDVMRGWFYHLIGCILLEERAETHIIARDQSVMFNPATGSHQDLKQLIELYQEGCTIPSPLQVEPAYAYAKQVVKNRGKGRKEPIRTACERLRDEIDKGYEAEKTLLYGDEPVERILSEKFVELCETIMVPLLDQLTHTGTGGSDG